MRKNHLHLYTVLRSCRLTTAGYGTGGHEGVSDPKQCVFGFLTNGAQGQKIAHSCVLSSVCFRENAKVLLVLTNRVGQDD